jgi:gamma-glutamyl-gamma-aminobutyrate hydrolase PuuD
MLSNPSPDSAKHAIRRPLIGLSGRIERNPISQASVRSAYVDAVFGAGGMPVVLPVVPARRMEEWVSVLDGLILTGGEDVNPLCYGQPPRPGLGAVDSSRDGFELALVGEWLRAGKPLLGICRGIQVLQVALGGALIQDIPTEQPEAYRHSHAGSRGDPVHEVEVVAGSTLARLLEAHGPVRVNSIHHQAVARPVEGFRVTARSGDGVIEAIEAEDGRPVLGVQWHPEEMACRIQKNLFANFIGAIWSVTTRRMPARLEAAR